MIFKITFYSINKFRSLIKVQKDPLATSSRRNIVYKIACKDCEASYVGQTGRQLHTRISEHRNHIRRKTISYLIITDHRL